MPNAETEAHMSKSLLLLFFRNEEDSSFLKKRSKKLLPVCGRTGYEA
jgi:hypothetical protein